MNAVKLTANMLHYPVSTMSTKERKCSICKEAGHNKTKCPTVVGVAEPTESDLMAAANAVMFITWLAVWLAAHPNPEITRLRNTEVVQWLCGDLSFLPKTTNKKEAKAAEDEWGRKVATSFRPDLKCDEEEKQWTTNLGQDICKEFYVLSGHTVSKIETKDHLAPDWETDKFILEAKTQTFHTTGTAGEKVLGTPFKYAEVPGLYGGKPLKIVCMAGIEKICREQYGNLAGTKTSPKKKEILDFFRDKLQIEYVAATDILNSLCVSA